MCVCVCLSVRACVRCGSSASAAKKAAKRACVCALHGNRASIKHLPSSLRCLLMTSCDLRHSALLQTGRGGGLEGRSSCAKRLSVCRQCFPDISQPSSSWQGWHSCPDAIETFVPMRLGVRVECAKTKCGCKVYDFQ